jgi:hypothetical protein
MKDGRPNLSAPAPRATNGKPDLTGVWMHETFSLEQMKKFYGPAADEEANIGMEIFTVHKYGLNALLDAKPGEQVMTAAGQAAFKRRQQNRNLKDVCHSRYGWPVLSLLSEPFKIVQARQETMIVYEIDNQHRQVFTDDRKFPAEFEFPARLGYSIGRWEGDICNRIRSHTAAWDLIVVGGGATGVGAAIDAAARGHDVLLLEQSDFGKGTSSRSTKLVHGGVRYLEQGNLPLVTEALKERGLLLRNAPHLVRSLGCLFRVTTGGKPLFTA